MMDQVGFQLEFIAAKKYKNEMYKTKALQSTQHLVSLL
jgi:hypothetical protein